MARLHLVKQFGIKLGGALRNMLRDNTAEHARFGTPSKSWVNTTCDAIGSDDPDSGPPPSAVAAVGPLLEEWIGMVRSEDERQNQCRTRRTNVDAHLLEAWRAASPDPDSQIYLWLTDGSPTGITSPLIDPGIFPEVSRPADMQPQDLHCDEQQFQNYPAVEEQAITDTELTSHLDKGHIVAFDTYAELWKFVNSSKPILNKLGLIAKTRNGISKVRMILDTKQSGVKRITSQAQRVTLPRVFDAILQLLFLQSVVASGDSTAVSAFVLDFSDAFWQLPISPAEQKYFCAIGLIGGLRKWISFQRAPQGSAVGPTLWGRLAALIMRLTQSLVDPHEARLVCYVYDPLAAIRGTDEERRAIAAMMMLVWCALGFKLAFAKGQLAKEVTWIGGTLIVEVHGVRVVAKQSIIDDIIDTLTRFVVLTLVPKRELHSIIGKFNHAAGLLIVMRPFLEPLWAALKAASPKDKPGLYLWIKQVQTELRWFHTFFLGNGTSIERFFALDAYNRVGTIIEIGTDASPWGLGGWLAVNGVITQYFTSALTQEDSDKFGLPLGEACGQQVWEALAILVAVVLWTHIWKQERIVPKVKSDNVTALTLLIKMHTSSSTLAVIARELALRRVDLSFPPDAAHTAGVGHISADKLRESSRRPARES